MIRHLWTGLALAISASPAAAYDIESVLDLHILPGFSAFAAEAEDLDAAAQADCTATDPELRNAFNDAFDAWMRVSHLRFGPTEAEDRAFALAFWPDSRGYTPRELKELIATQDPAVESPESFSQVSIAARGFYAMEFLLYDPEFMQAQPAPYRCNLVQAVARDIAAISEAILQDWEGGYADLLRHPGENETYRDKEEVTRELLGALASALQFTSDTRIGRPLGTYDKPRATRAEARRSGRSLRNVVLSLQGTRQLVMLLAEDSEDVTATMTEAYERALTRAEGLSGDPVFAGVDDPMQRLQVEILKQDIDRIREAIETSLSVHLGAASGFNALDGD